MNEIKSFTFYSEYFKLIDNLSTREEKEKLLYDIFEYVFKDIEPNLEGMSEAIFINLKRPIDISKSQSKRRIKKETNEENINPKETGEKPEENQSKTGEKPQKNTSMMSMSNKNKKDNRDKDRGMGEEEEKEEKGNDDVSLLNELPEEDTDDTSKLGEMSKKIIDYLNKQNGTRYRSNSKSTLSHINARFSEGFTIDDFKIVIDKKVKEWTGTDYEKHLCPDTLFGTKFEKYLNQKIVDKPTGKEKNVKKFQDYSNKREYDDLDEFYDDL